MKKRLLSPFTLKSAIGLLFLVFLFVFSLTYVLEDLKYYTMSKEILRNFFPIKWWLIGHISGGIIALLIGPFQFWSNFRNKYLKLHRSLGKIYLISILLSAVCSTVMAWTTAIELNFAWAFSLQVLAFAWVVTAFMAYYTIRKKRVQDHRKWMIRSYIVTFGFISFRWIMPLPIIQKLGSFPEIAPTVIWSAWAIPLLIMEVVFQIKKTK